MSFGKNPQIFTPIPPHQQHETPLGTKCSRYQPYPDQQKNRPHHNIHNYYDTVVRLPDYYVKQPRCERSVISNITESTELRVKPKPIKRISIDTLIHDSDDDRPSQSTNSSQFDLYQESHQSATLVNSDNAQASQEISSAILDDPYLHSLNEVKRNIQTPEGFKDGCAGLSKWLNDVSFQKSFEFAEELVDIIDDIIRYALKDDFNTYSAYFLLYEISRCKSYSFMGLYEMLTPWVHFFKKYISSKVDDSRRLVSEFNAAKLDTPMFPRDFYLTHKTVLHKKGGRPKSLGGKYVRPSLGIDLIGSFSMSGDPEENLLAEDTNQNVKLTKELGPFGSLEKKYHISKQLLTQNSNFRNDVPKYTRVIRYLIAPVVIKSESTYVDVNFSLDRAQCRAFDPKLAITEHILQLYCYEESDPYQHLRWPEGMCVEINSFEIPVKSDASSKKTLDQFYISNNHPPTISGFKSKRDTNYVIQLRMIELLSRRKAYDIALLNNLAQKSDWEADPKYYNHIFAMRCYLTQKTMEAPTKGKYCRHSELFDFKSWLHVCKDDVNPQCPICDIPLTIDKLLVFHKSFLFSSPPCSETLPSVG